MFTYDKKTASVYNSNGEMVERAARPDEAATIGLPWWYGLGIFAENAAELGLTTAKLSAAVPVMIIALVLKPTPAGEGSTVDQYVLNSRGGERNWRDDKPLSPGDIKQLEKQGWNHRQKGRHGGQRDLYKDKEGNVYEKPKGGNGPGELIDYHLK